MRRTACVLVLALALPTAACAGRILTLGSRADGSTARLHVGGILAITLPGEPDTGYRWIIAHVDSRVLASGLPSFEAGSPNPDGPGIYTLAFRASAAGHTRLELAYVPNGRRGGAIMAFSLTVRVSKP